MNLITKNMVDAIEKEVDRISEIQENMAMMTDQKRYELLQQVIQQYKDLLIGNGNMLRKRRG